MSHINIITRTRHRPNHFKKCRESIASQTYPSQHVSHLVTFDDEVDLNSYISGYQDQGLIILEVTCEKRKNAQHFPYTNYLLECFNHIENTPELTGWTLILNDDNWLTSPQSLSDLVSYIQNHSDVNERSLLIWKCQQSYGILPSNETFGKLVKSTDIDLACIAIHSTQLSKLRLEPKKNSVGLRLAELCGSGQLTAKWINSVLTNATGGGNGLAEDLIPQVTPQSQSQSKSKSKLKLKLTPQVQEQPQKPQQPQPSSPTLSVIEEEPSDVIDSLKSEHTQTQTCDTSIDTKNSHITYVFNDESFQLLSHCLSEATQCINLQDYLIKLLNTKQQLKQQIQALDSLTNTTPTPTLNPSSTQIRSPNSTPTPTSSVTILVTSPIPIYIIIPAGKNAIVERNLSILNKANLKFETIQSKSKELDLFSFQSKVIDCLNNAIANNLPQIMILNGMCPLNHKFSKLLPIQLNKCPDTTLIWFLGQNREVTPREMLSTAFSLDDYLAMYDDIASAKLNTEVKAHLHWKSYGHREARYAKVDCVASKTQVDNNYGVMITFEMYAPMLDFLSKQSQGNVSDVFKWIQSNVTDNSISLSRPDLIIPSFSNASNHEKNQQQAVKKGWYYNFFKA
jgi:hypothetical protein